MSGIHEEILTKIVGALQVCLIDGIDPTDAARAGVVMTGPLQGDPDPDIARISITVHENDPDQLLGGAGLSRPWQDEPISVEIGSGRAITTWSRKFVVKARCLLEGSHEDLEQARAIASTLRSRIEKCLSAIDFAGVETDDEEVTYGIVSFARRGETLQSGGPPDAYDFHIKFKFDLWTTEK